MKHFTLNLALLLIVNSQLIAQSDFREGFLIKNNNDTVFGYIDYKGNATNATKCIFKTNLNAESSIYYPQDIKAYRFTNSKFYVSKKVMQMDEQKQLFLEYLIDGIVDIYYYRDHLGEHYFVNNGEELRELKNERKEIIRDNKTYVKESKEHIGILKYVFRESPKVSKSVETIDLSHKSLVKISQQYHEEVCHGEECIIYEKQVPKAKKTSGIIIGINGLFLSYTDDFADEFYYMRNSQFNFKVYPSFGYFYKRGIPDVNERFFIQYNLTYTRYKMETSNSYIEPVYGLNYLNDISLTLNTLNNDFIFKYESPKGKARPTFMFGGFLNYIFRTNYSRELEVLYSWGDTYYTESTMEYPFKRYDLGLSIGMGLNLYYWENKDVFMDLRYQRGFGLTSDINTNTLMLNVAFEIGG